MQKLKPLAVAFVDVLSIAGHAIAASMREAVICYLLSQQNEDGGFAGRDGTSDVFDTMFGELMTFAFELKVDTEPLVRFLRNTDVSKLDAIHRAFYLNARLVAELMTFTFKQQRIAIRMFPESHFFQRRFAEPMRALFSPIPLQLNDYPNRDPHAPYASFIDLFSSQALDIHLGTCDFSAYRTPEGLYSDLPGGVYRATATAAALIVNYYDRCGAREEALKLQAKQLPNGAFLAWDGAHEGDLHSTAVALFALHLYDIKPRYSVKNFLRECMRADGGFANSINESRVSLETTFYGLLCMGVTI